MFKDKVKVTVVALVMVLLMVLSITTDLFVGLADVFRAKAEEATPTDATPVTRDVTVYKELNDSDKDRNLAGAVIKVFKDSACTQSITEFVLSYDGKSYGGDDRAVYKNLEERANANASKAIAKLQEDTYYYQLDEKLFRSNDDYNKTGYDYNNTVSSFSIVAGDGVQEIKLDNNMFRPTEKVATPTDASSEVMLTEDVHQTDTVTLDGLTKGEGFTLKGVVYNKSTRKPMLVNGKQVTNSIDFTAKGNSEEVALKYQYNGLKSDAYHKDKNDDLVSFIYDYANYALGPDNANAEKVAIEDGGIFRFNWIAPITDQSYLIFCYQQSEDMFVCIAWSLFFGIKTFKDVVITIISILDRIVWIPCIVTIDNYAWYFYTAFCVIYFYLRKFLPAAKVVGVIVDSCLTLIAVACIIILRKESLYNRETLAIYSIKVN